MRDEMNFFNAFRVAEKARHSLEKVLGSTYYMEPAAANQISDLMALASKTLQAIEVIGIRNRDEYSRKNAKPFPLNRKAFKTFFRSITNALDGVPEEEEPPLTTKPPFVYVYKVLVEVEFTYDEHCRSISAVGGFLYGMLNQHFFARDNNEKPVHELAFRQIDTLCKILEGRPQLVDPKAREVAQALAERLHQTLDAINVEHARLNPNA
jgi:hypothetical protein